jgi:hypothetical protein
VASPYERIFEREADGIVSLLVDCRHCGRPECSGECLAPAPRRRVVEEELRGCPNPNPYTGATCKRRNCRWCGGPWARNVSIISSRNLDHYARERHIAQVEASVVMISITPPGKETLPWACAKEHDHSGTRGCKVDDEAADRWCAYARKDGWRKLRDAARKAVARAGFPTAHLIDRTGLGAAEARRHPPARRSPAPRRCSSTRPRTSSRRSSRREPTSTAIRLRRPRRAADQTPPAPSTTTATASSSRRAPAPGRCRRSRVRTRASYLVSYLTGRNRFANTKTTMRDNIADPRMPRSIWWVTPALTSTSESERIAAMRERLDDQLRAVA